MSLQLPFEDFENEILDLICTLKTDIESGIDFDCVVCGENQNEWKCYQLPCLHYGMGDTPITP